MGVPFLDGFASETTAARKLEEFFSFYEKKDLEKTKELFAKYGFYTESQYILDQLARVNLERGNKQAILITGEPGTGKSYLIIFSEKAPFQEVKLKEIPAHLIESKLFGCESAYET